MEPVSSSKTERLLRTLRGTPRTYSSPLTLLSVAAWLSVAGCQEDPATHRSVGAAAGGVGSVPGQTPGKSDANRGTEYEGADPKAERQTPAWNEPAKLGTVRGRVLDAVTGAEITGSVLTTAGCSGEGCTAATAGAPGFVTPLEKGVFSFDAAPSAESKLKPALLELSPATAFTITAKDYEPLVIAHGPRATPQKGANGQSFTELPTLYLCPKGATHSDDDKICDAAEAKYGTNPNQTDEDKDALSDSLELLGHPADDSTTYDIRSLGADPHQRDIFIAVRYTARAQHPGNALTLVEKAFADAPSPDGKVPAGIRLHLVYDERRLSGADDVEKLDDGFVQFKDLADRYYGPRPAAFHYALFAHKYVDSMTGDETSSGLSNEVAAAEFIVTLGAFPNATDLQQAGTFMHELGHNLNLWHGGNDDEVFKPGYPSIMNYNYQMNGIQRGSDTVLDYARIKIGPFNEAAVNEQRPFAAGTGTTDAQLAEYKNPRVASYDPATRKLVFPTVEGNLAGPLDLNLNGKIEANTCTVFDFVYSGKTRNSKETRNDWETLKLDGGPTGRVGDVAVPQSDIVVRTVESGHEGPCLSANMLAEPLEPTSDSYGTPGGTDDEPPESWPEYAPPAPVCPWPGQPQPATDPTNTPEAAPKDDSTPSATDTGRTPEADKEPSDPAGPTDTDPNGSTDKEDEDEDEDEEE